MTCPQVIKVVTPGPPGPAGPTGPAGVGAAWQQGEGAPASGLGANGDFYLNTTNGDIYGPKTAGAWGGVIFNIAEGQQGPAGADGADGADGAAGADGSDGREVEFQASGTHIQWRYVGESSWINLVALSTITGPAGADGADGQDGAPGAAGSDGDDGREVELQTSATHVQWRYVGEATWTDLVALSVITGPAGADGADGADGAQGPAGADGADGADAAYSDETPQPLGAATAGTAASASRADHVHALPPLVSTSSAGLAPETGTAVGEFLRDDATWAYPIDTIVLACSDETTALTTGTNKVRFRMPFAATLLAVRANVNTAPTGSTLIVDINETGTSVLGTKLSIDASETSSTTAASAATITDSALADDAEISIDIDQIGSTVAGAGLKVILSVRRV